ncbi:unnamed protein product [Mytilus edulis]|uniref:TNFR-Cys domain-containing protein n=1 Tax=Mytilus edulis TaxID=6550 RepID=A0A8S3TLC4_MYTED|nr:unnamed protein product [Mytilus edulis]
MRNILTYALFFYLNVVSGKICKTCKNNTNCQYYCCDNFELNDGKCQECKIGSTSMQGNACYPCKGMSYGKKCGLECHCLSHQMCHNEHGCLTVTSVETTNTGITEYITTAGFHHSKESKGRMLSTSLLTYIGITGCSALTLAICVICRQRAMDRLRQIKNCFKTSPPNDSKLQVPDKKKLTEDDSFKRVNDEQYVVENALYEEVQ